MLRTTLRNTLNTRPKIDLANFGSNPRTFDTKPRKTRVPFNKRAEAFVPVPTKNTVSELFKPRKYAIENSDQSSQIDTGHLWTSMTTFDSQKGKLTGKQQKHAVQRLNVAISTGPFAENWQKFQFEKLMPRIQQYCKNTESHVYKLDNVNSFSRLAYFKSMHFPDSPDLSPYWIEYLTHKISLEDGLENGESNKITEYISKIEALKLDFAIDAQNLLTSLNNTNNKRADQQDWTVGLKRQQYEYFLTRLKLSGKTYKVGLTKTALDWKSVQNFEECPKKRMKILQMKFQDEQYQQVFKILESYNCFEIHEIPFDQTKSGFTDDDALITTSLLLKCPVISEDNYRNELYNFQDFIVKKYGLEKIDLALNLRYYLFFANIPAYFKSYYNCIKQPFTDFDLEQAKTALSTPFPRVIDPRLVKYLMHPTTEQFPENTWFPWFSFNAFQPWSYNRRDLAQSDLVKNKQTKVFLNEKTNPPNQRMVHNNIVFCTKERIAEYLPFEAVAERWNSPDFHKVPLMFEAEKDYVITQHELKSLTENRETKSYFDRNLRPKPENKTK
jgi:hypothetical protein